MVSSISGNVSVSQQLQRQQEQVSKQQDEQKLIEQRQEAQRQEKIEQNNERSTVDSDSRRGSTIDVSV